jgi:hypothetical protein
MCRRSACEASGHSHLRVWRLSLSAAIRYPFTRSPTYPKQDLRPSLHLAVFHCGENRYSPSELKPLVAFYSQHRCWFSGSYFSFLSTKILSRLRAYVALDWQAREW